MSRRRVVITGLGIVSPVGNSVDEAWQNILAGRSGIGPVTKFDASTFPTKIAGEVKNFEPTQYFKNPKDVRRTDRYTQLGMAASKMALQDSGVDLEALDRTRFGVVIGSGIGGLKTLSDQITVMNAKGPGRISPFMIPMMISNMVSGLVSMEYGLGGPNFSPVSACATAR